MPTVHVFGSPAATEVARVLTCLLEKNVDFQLVRTDTYRGEHQIPEYLKMKNPAGQVMYTEGGKTLADSRDICRYVTEKYPGRGNPKLLGTGALERSSVEQWLQVEATRFDPPSSALVFHLAFAPLMPPTTTLPSDPEKIRRCKEELANVLDLYEDRLRETRFIAGDDFSLADLSHLPNMHYLVNKALPRPVEGGLDVIGTRKNVARWWADISRNKSWQQVVALQGESPFPVGN